MKRVRRGLGAWDAFWFAPASPYPIAAFRIALGTYLLVYLGYLLPHVEVLFSDHGVYAPYLVPDYAPPPLIAHAVFGAWMATAAALTAGLCVRLMAPLAILLFLYHYFLQLAVKQSSFERLIVIYLVVLACAGGQHAWALGAARGGAGATVWPRRVLLMQTAALYFGAGLWKALNPQWHTGRLLEATLQGIWATRLGFWIAAQGWSETTWTALSWGVIAFELLLGLGFLWRRARVVAVFAGTLFHLANATILAIPEFLVCLTPYPLFLPEHFVERVGKAVGRGAAWLRLRRPGWNGRARAS